MKPFKVLPHTADLAIEVWGNTLEELFENSARGMFHLIYEKAPEAQGHSFKKKFKTKNAIPGDIEMLLNLFLTTLLKFHSEEKTYLHEIAVKKLTPRKVIFCGEFYKTKENPAHEIKSVTFHGLKIEKENQHYKTMIVFDV